IEYLFLNIRAKSVGETLEVNVTCPDDGETQVQLEIDLDSIKVQKDDKHNSIIQIDDTLSMKMKYPSINQFVENNFEIQETGEDVNKSLEMITSCIEMVYNQDECWSASDCTKQELQDFVEQMNTKQFKEIEK
ncbi:MAG: baseplate protein, partial [bacterium]